MFGYITGPDEVSLFAVSQSVSPAVSEQLRPAVTLPDSAGLQRLRPPLKTSGVLARGLAHDVLRVVGQPSCVVLR